VCGWCACLSLEIYIFKEEERIECTMSPKQVTDLTLAIGNLATATLAVSDAAKRFEGWSSELEAKEAKLNQMEERLIAKERDLKDTEKRAKEVEKRSEQLEKKEINLRELEVRLNAKEKELEDKEKRWKEVEERMKGYEVAVKRLEENAAKLGHVVKLTVGTNPLIFSFPFPHLFLCLILSYMKVENILKYQKLLYLSSRALILMHCLPLILSKMRIKSIFPSPLNFPHFISFSSSYF
jgi:myosin heavy subunit